MDVAFVRDVVVVNARGVLEYLQATWYVHAFFFISNIIISSELVLLKFSQNFSTGVA